MIGVWQIGGDGTEYYAANSEQELRDFYIGLVGKEQAEEDFTDEFRKLTDSEMDAEFDFNDDGDVRRTTFRKLANDAVLPTQISSGYY